MNDRDAISAADFGGDRVALDTCLDCDVEMEPTDSGRCVDCQRQRDEDGPDDDPDAWSGGFASNH